MSMTRLLDKAQHGDLSYLCVAVCDAMVAAAPLARALVSTVSAVVAAASRCCHTADQHLRRRPLRNRCCGYQFRCQIVPGRRSQLPPLHMFSRPSLRWFKNARGAAIVASANQRVDLYIRDTVSADACRRSARRWSTVSPRGSCCWLTTSPRRIFDLHTRTRP